MGVITFRNITHLNSKLDLYAVTQHTSPVSSNSPQKRIGFKPASCGLFFRLPPLASGQSAKKTEYAAFACS
jgi:hypothetical protein